MEHAAVERSQRRFPRRVWPGATADRRLVHAVPALSKDAAERMSGGDGRYQCPNAACGSRGALGISQRREDIGLVVVHRDMRKVRKRQRLADWRQFGTTD